MERAIGGDVSAAALVLSRAWPARKGRPTPIKLPEVVQPSDLALATGAVVEGLANGTLTPDEAQAVSAILTAHRAALETTQLERRIAALEATQSHGGNRR